jgi:hypothetical protein
MIRIKWKHADSAEISLGMMSESEFTYQCTVRNPFVLRTEDGVVLGWYDCTSGITTWAIIDFKETI